MNSVSHNKVEKENDPLWKDFLQGDKTAFEKIYRLYISDLLNYGYKVISERRLIEDSIQDLFFELWKTKENLSDTSSIKFYLFRALRYKIVRNLKVNKSDVTESLDEMDTEVDFSHESYLIELESHSIQMAHLREGIGKLPKRQQEAINLRYYHNFSNEEIAAIMEVNYQSACKFIYAAIKNLKLNLKVSAFSFLPIVAVFIF